MKYVIRIILLISTLLIFVLVRIDRVPFEKTEHFEKWRSSLAQFDVSSGAFTMGWSVKSITPDFSAPLAGYGKRKGKHFEGVNDSIYVRSVALSDTERTVYLVSADLLFIPPKVLNLLEEKLKPQDISLNDLHLSATHSHSSLGGWEESMIGWVFGGKYDAEVVEFLANQFYDAIIESSSQMLPGEVYYSEVIDNVDVVNRVEKEDGMKDTEIRSLTFENFEGEKAYLITYAAHSTVYGADMSNLSRDYSGALVDSLQPDFGMYMAGAVASMGPTKIGDTPEGKIERQAGSILNHFRERDEKKLDNTIISEWIKVPLPEPTARITRHWALRPWVFKKIFGDYEVFIKVTKIGSTLILGMPADFSGEIMVDLDKYATAKGIDLIITSFNGGYIGYITDDGIYDSGHYETTTMSWYGYQMGGYFKQISIDIIDKVIETNR